MELDILRQNVKIQVLFHFLALFTPWFPQIYTNDYETLLVMEL